MTPVKASRAPLQSKEYLSLGNAPATPLATPAKSVTAKKLDDTYKPSKLRTEKEDAPLPSRHHARRSRKVVMPRSPSASPQAVKTHATPVYRGIGLPRYMPTPRTLRGETVLEVEIITKLRNVLLDKPTAESKPSEPGPSKPPTPDLSRLLSICTVDEILPFDEVFTHSKFLELLPQADKRTSSPVVRKLGEASYSEVFSVSAQEGSVDVVVKVIPLLGFSNLRGKQKTEVELPDCSEVDDVAREIGVTKRMSRVPGGGFVDFLG